MSDRIAGGAIIAIFGGRHLRGGILNVKMVDSAKAVSREESCRVCRLHNKRRASQFDLDLALLSSQVSASLDATGFSVSVMVYA